jgi:transcriptional regulator with XRE-family HTH domain
MTADTSLQALADRIKGLRASRALTQEDLASMAGVGVATIQRAERGQRLSADTIASLAAALNMEARDLTGAVDGEEQPYLPLQVLTTGRELLAILAGSARLDFGFAELDDLDDAALVDTLHTFCSPVGAERIPNGPLARVKLEIEVRDLLASLRDRGLIVTGGSYMVNCHEVDDDCGAGMPILLAQWSDVCGVIRVGASGVAIERAYITEGLGQWESPGDGVVFPAPPDRDEPGEQSEGFA